MDETTIFFAKLASAYFIVTGVGFLLSTDFYEKMVNTNASVHPVSLNLSGAVHFLVGMSVLLQHFRWGNLLEVIITLIGFAATLKGVGLIVVPELTLKSPKTGRTALRLSGVGFLTIGTYLGYMGYLR
ncbi:hypothetical protein [Mastigocoleus testarum]|uniref:Uncharacterized protein n=1 Tax=Mastigocoleus testarum BC008 TaxID=371196 RepID=A0A0V7ZV70_9CYAN|nr:hypothetical protein [Mastigocoleus testarum]KST68499.1 hypothetical protein BC008_01120 [Mastigocoleus testarum BC008]